MSSLKDKVVLVTGGSQGIGQGIVESLKAKGAIVVVFDINENADDSVSSYIVDITDSDKVKETMNEVIEKFGKIDALVNNAGITSDGLVHKLTDQEWQSVLSVNLTGAFNMIRELSEHMIENNQGVILNISSIVGRDGNIGQANYAASKAGLIGLSSTLAKELSRKGAQIRVNTITPGFINTDMIKTVPEKLIERLIKQVPLKRLGEVEDISNLVAFLISDEASYINGQVIGVDGGLKL